MWELLAQRNEPLGLWVNAVGQEADLSSLKLLRIQNAGDAAELLQLYQLYQTLAKRLCDLQSNLLLQYSMLQKLDGFLLQLKLRFAICYTMPELERTAHTESELALARLMSIPDDDQLQTDYLRLIKWAAMSSREDAKAFLLQRLSKKLIKNGEDGLPDILDRPVLNRKSFGKVIQQENTRMLYSGIKRLDERMCTETDFDTDWDRMERAEKNAWEEAKAGGATAINIWRRTQWRICSGSWTLIGSGAAVGQNWTPRRLFRPIWVS